MIVKEIPGFVLAKIKTILSNPSNLRAESFHNKSDGCTEMCVKVIKNDKTEFTMIDQYNDKTGMINCYIIEINNERYALADANDDWWNISRKVGDILHASEGRIGVYRNDGSR